MFSKKNIQISIIIPTFNEENIIEKCMNSLAGQDYQNFEVILVDDSSYDRTVLFAKTATKKFKFGLKVINLKNRKERSFARNLGVKKALGKYLLFVDADMELDKKVLAECIDIVKSKSEIRGLIIPEESFGRGFWAQCKKLERRCYLGDASIEAARFFEKKAFLKIKGWDARMISGEDWDLTKRFRSIYKIGRIDSKIYHNEGKITLLQIAKKKFYYASRAEAYLKKYPLSLKDIILFIFRPAYFRNWRLFLLNPIQGIGLVVLKLVEIIAGVLGYLYSKFVNLAQVFAL